jgi:GTP-binding protein HflX
VGFIRDLPEELVAAFRATLEEMADADLLVHVVDASDPDRDAEIRAVEGILGDLGLGDKPRVLVWNKADKLDQADADLLGRDGFVVSALDRATLGPLLLGVERELWAHGVDAPVAHA